LTEVAERLKFLIAKNDSLSVKVSFFAKNSLDLSFCFEFDGENINNIEVMQSRVNVTNTTYDEVDRWLVAGSNESLAKIQAIGITHKAFRDSKGSINLT
jgi:hypothetical protein